MIKQNISLKNYNTFGIDSKTRYFSEISNEKDLIEKIEKCKKTPFRILGEGSNILLTKDYKGYTFVIKNKGINILQENESEIVVEVQAGENWHSFVLWALEKNYAGIENLAFIPGTVGAAPIQNIGAYGVELKTVFKSCRALEIETLTFKIFNKEDCDFKYRSSIFKKQLKEKVIITSVCFVLQKQPHKMNTDYDPLKNALKGKENTIQNIANAVIDIRKSKLPDPSKIGNSGSFFKNPIINEDKFLKLKNKYPDIPNFFEPYNKIKIPAAWLIEKIGYKGKRFGNAGIHNKQALVIVNYGNAKGSDILILANEIKEKILIHFGIKLEFEVNLF